MNARKGFTLIEILVVLAIVAVVFAAAAFGLSGARGSARDQRRKADLAVISSALEKYRSDCGRYPTASQYNSVSAGGNLTGNGSAPSCTSGSIYINGKPEDLERPTRVYSYNVDALGSDYTLCASLEGESTPVPSGCVVTCGQACNYAIKSP